MNVDARGWPSQPPADYVGQRVGDVVMHPRHGRMIVAELLPNPAHWCDRGWSCARSWRVLLVRRRA